MERPVPGQREVGNSQFGNNTTIHQDNNTFSFHLPLRPARPAIRIIPYPLNEDLVDRPDIMGKVDALLPQAPHTYCSAALWGLGGSGKTQIALNYAYQRCNKRDCSVFWVHADSEATFSQDYKTIAQAFGIDQQLKGEELYAAVCDQIAAQPDWVLILDNTDDLRQFGVEQAPQQTNSLYRYIPKASTGTVLWTSRDAHIVGTLVGSTRGIEVARMNYDEAEILLKLAGSLEVGREKMEIITLLEELQWLPLAIMQAGSYMRRTSTSAKEYSSLLAQNKKRWQLLKEEEFDRHRKPYVPNNVLETLSISIDRLKQDSEIAYNILHAIAYVSNQNIPHEIITTILKHCDNSLVDPEKLEAEATKAIMRLKEFSFLGVHRTEDGGRSYEMHKLVQEATRYGLSLCKPSVPDNVFSNREGERYFSGIAVQAILDLFPDSELGTWSQCEKYLAHAVQTVYWADLNDKRHETSLLFYRVSLFLHDCGRWSERELVNKKGLEFDREIWGEKHPDTFISMEHLATTYRIQCRHKEAEALEVQILDLRRETLGKKHPHTLMSMENLATTHWAQCQYKESEALEVQVLDLRREILGDKHPDTIQTIGALGIIYRDQGLYKKAEPLLVQVFDLSREILGDKHLRVIWSMESLGITYGLQGRYKEAEALQVQVYDLRREILGTRHPETFQGMSNLSLTYWRQGRYKEAEALQLQVFKLQQEILGERHPDTIRSISNLSSIYGKQGRRKEAEAESIQIKVFNFRREILGDKHPETIWSMEYLSSIYGKKGLYEESEALAVQVLDLRRESLGEEHPDTIRCVEYKRSVLGPEHPETALSVKVLETWEREDHILESNEIDSQNEETVGGPQQVQTKTSRLRKMADTLNCF
ncbi:tetratricopeptide repeat domain-containing protein [Trichoderma breve]|uniref:Tetratricopeptide repeat domain-containing protein n=1 Tax=Trichoderma breve TaxID=2034170 RepID=A0A9W9BG60_9HYPO|nr:tetratricopeptide repeat domain-containing protein [Trichoderma breve]KAJ4860754.1 tetratricopeptide repeat domain-containing protein [Trichoderma breve]